MGSAHLTPLLQGLSHEHPQGVHGPGHERMHTIPHGLVEGGQPDTGGEGSRLVVHEHDLGFPLTPGTPNDPGLHHVQHVGVPVVVVPHILLIQLGHGRRLVGSSHIGEVPLRHLGLAVRIQGGPEHEDDVVEDGLDFRVVAAGEEVVDQLDRVLMGCGLGGMNRPIDVNDGLSFLGQCPGLSVGKPLRMGQSIGDSPIVVHLGQVLRRREKGHVEGAALGGSAPPPPG